MNKIKKFCFYLSRYNKIISSFIYSSMKTYTKIGTKTK